MTRTIFVILWATEKRDISICMYFVKQIQWCNQNHLWTSSLEPGSSSMDQKGFMKDDKIYFWGTKKCDYKLLCTLQDKFNGVVRITFEHLPWSKEDPPGIRKGSEKMTRFTFVYFWATEKCHILICMYFVRQIQQCDQNHLWTWSMDGTFGLLPT